MKSRYAATPVRMKWRRLLGIAFFAVGFLSLFMSILSIVGVRSSLPSGYTAKGGLDLEIRQPVESHDVKNSDTFQDMKNSSDKMYNNMETLSQVVTQTGDLHSANAMELERPPSPSVKDVMAHAGRVNVLPAKRKTSDGNKQICQLRFGSYCLWSAGHRFQMKDRLLKRFKAQLFMARAYYPSIPKLKSHEKLSQEMKQKIQEYEREFSEASTDRELPPYNPNTIKKMDSLIAEAKSYHVNCDNTCKKFAQLVDSTEDEAFFHMRRSAFLYHLVAHTMPKSLHCLYLRLTVEYFKYPSLTHTAEIPYAEKFDGRDFQHYVIFSKNMLASSVTINSTVTNAQESGNLVFHVITNGLNYYSMKFWFSMNNYKNAIINVMNIDDLELNSSYSLHPWHLSLSEEFRVSIGNIDHPSDDWRTEYISVFGHAQFLLPKIFKDLKRVILLEDDVVVQQDLSWLWNLSLDGKVNAAIYFCNVRLDDLRQYLGRNTYRSGSCLWMTGLNILDLEKWREHDVTSIYESLLQEVPSETEASWRSAALRISYLAFQDLVYPLDESLVLSGLGNEYSLSKDAIENASVLHFNGNMKPWLGIRVHKFKTYWRKFLTEGIRFVDECNVNI